jgi:hypothetical protein
MSISEDELVDDLGYNDVFEVARDFVEDEIGYTDAIQEASRVFYAEQGFNDPDIAVERAGEFVNTFRIYSDEPEFDAPDFDYDDLEDIGSSDFQDLMDEAGL